MGVAVPAVAGDQTEPNREAIERSLAQQFDSPAIRHRLDLERAKAARGERALQSPSAQLERARSRTAYTGAGPKRARDTLQAHFPDFPGSHVFEPLELRRGERVARYRGRHAALVATAGGKRLLAASTVPLRSTIGSGKPEPVDLRLAQRGDAFEAANPLIPVRLPTSLQRGIALPGTGLEIHVGSGAATAVEPVADAVLYSDVLPDTDLVASATPAGVELALQLRSALSPRSVPLRFDLPAGARLRLLDKADSRAHRGPEGAVEIVREGRRIATVLPPATIDSQGQSVPTRYVVEGDTLEVRVADGDFAYPLLVDPAIDDYQSEDFDFGGWSFLSSNPGLWADTYDPFGGWGLWLYADAGYAYNFGDWGEAYFQAPRRAYIERADFFNVGHIPANSCVEEGIWSWSKSNWDYGTWFGPGGTGASPWLAGDACNPQRGDYKTHCVGSSCDPGNPPGDAKGTPGNLVVFGMWNTLQGFRLEQATASMAQLTMYLYDDDTPSLSLSHSGLSADWVDGTTPSVTASAHDPGIGIAEVDLGLDDPSRDQVASEGCDGSHWAPCPEDSSHTFTYNTAQMAEGRYDVAMDAVDAVDHVTERTWQLKIDHSPPDIALSGELADLDRQPLDSDATLHIDARDGNSSSGDTARSGTKTVSVSIDAQTTPVASWTEQCNPDCPDASTHDYTFSPSQLNLADGPHTVKVTATDKLGHVSNDTIQVIVDRSPPSVPTTTHQGLPSGWTESAQPTVTATSSDRGTATAPEFGTGVHSFTLVTPTETSFDTHTQSFNCAGGLDDRCPEPGSKQLTYSTTTMPEGIDDVDVTASDALGHESGGATWQIKVDRSAPELVLSGDLQDGDAVDSDTNLAIEAYDGDPGSPETRRSGVKQVQVFVDAQAQPDASWSQACSATDGCPQSFAATYTFSPSRLALKDGRHTIRTVAEDQLGHQVTQTIAVIVDRTPPSQPTVTHDGAPSGWTDYAAPRFTATSSDRGTADAPDYGTGVQAFDLTAPGPDGTPNTTESRFACLGTIASRCPESATKTITYDTDGMAEGIDQADITALDALGHASAPASFTLKIDRSGPDLALSGPLKDLEDQTLWDEGSYALHVQSTDGTVQAPRSGVQRIDVSVDGTTKVSNTQQCTTDSCPLTLDWTLQAGDYSLGTHTIDVSTEDMLGHVSSQSWYVNVGESGTMISPINGERTARRLVLQATAIRGGLTGARFQFRRSNTETWQDIPVANVHDANDQSLPAWPVSLTSGKTPELFWDVPPTTGIDNQDGDIQVRAVMSGGPGGTSRAVKAKLDRKGIDVNHASEQIGPGTVDLLSGDFSLSASDASIPSFGTSLTVERTYNSRDVGAGSDGMFGPGWLTSVAVDDAGSNYVNLVESPASGGGTQAAITDSDGIQMTFVDSGGGFQAPQEFKDLTLTKSSGQYQLKDGAGNVTVFSQPASSESYVPTEVRQPGSANKTSYIYERANGVTRVKQVLAPVPAGVSCSTTLQAGCRALDFVYATQTTATGSAPDRWGDFQGRVQAVNFTAYDPAIAGMRTTAVATYSYDANGRLRAAWDPRVSPALKTTYDYDNLGHVTQLSPPGLQPWTFQYAPIAGDPETGRLKSVSRAALPGTATTTIAYGVPLTGTGAPYAMGTGDVATWAQQDHPTDATAIFPPDQTPSDPPNDYSRASIRYLDGRGHQVNDAEPGQGITTTEYDIHGNVIRQLTASNRQRALAGPNPASRAQQLDTQRTYSSDGVDLLDELGPLHEVTLNNGQKAQARQHTRHVYDEGAPTGGPYHLETTTTTGAQIPGQSQDVDVRVTKNDYSGQSNLGWQLRKPTGITTDAASNGLNLVSRTLYDATTALATETRMPANTNGGDAHSSQTLFYTAGDHPTDPDCGHKPEWANLPCKQQPATEPSTPGLPELPTTSYTYTYLGQTATETDTAAGVTRTSNRTYDSAGRPVDESVASPIGTALPTTHTDYDSQTGLPTAVSTTDGAITRTITQGHDSLGRLTTYTDADGATSTTTYDLLGRPVTTSDGLGSQTRTYHPITGRVTQLDDSAAGRFTATYDADGHMVSQTYPNGLKAQTTYDESGSPVRLTYDKQSDCAPDGCRWFDFRVSESIHGQWRSQTSELSSQQYNYDGAGRLTQVQDTVPGTGCTSRVYTYDRDSNRLSLTTRPPGAAGACDTTAPPSTQAYAYDSADRLYGSGYSYDEWGRITSVPPPDSGSQSPLTSTYYVNDQTESETQAGSTTAFTLDPARRPRLRDTTSSLGAGSEETIHYSDSSDSPSWTSITTPVLGVQSTRNIEGIDGNLAALQNSLTGTTIEIADLHGDIVADASPSEKISKPLRTFDATEFGVPRANDTDPTMAGAGAQRTLLPGAHRRYSWLGAKERATELDSGVIQMGVRSYAPAIGRFLQSDPVPGGSANDYDYAGQDPVNAFDLEGTCAFDRDVSPKIIYRRTAAYWELCHTSGTYAGRRAGWLRIPMRSGRPVRTRGRLAGTLYQRVAGLSGIAYGTWIQARCLGANLPPLIALHCLGLGSSASTGGAILYFNSFRCFNRGRAARRRCRASWNPTA